MDRGVLVPGGFDLMAFPPSIRELLAVGRAGRYKMGWTIPAHLPRNLSSSNEEAEVKGERGEARHWPSTGSRTDAVFPGSSLILEGCLG